MWRLTVILVLCMAGFSILLVSATAFAESSASPEKKPDYYLKEFMLKRLEFKVDSNYTNEALKVNQSGQITKDNTTKYIYGFGLKYAISPAVLRWPGMPKSGDAEKDEAAKKATIAKREKNVLNAFTLYVQGNYGNAISSSDRFISSLKTEDKWTFKAGLTFTLCLGNLADKEPSFGGGCSSYK